MHGMEDIIFLAFMATGAYFTPIISKKLMMPSAVAEFFYGLLLGTFWLKESTPSESVKVISEIGFLLLMYIAGLELDFDRIATLKPKDLVAYGGYAALLVAASLLFAHIAGFPRYFIIILITTAIGLLFSVLKELNMVKSSIGQILILVGVIGEVITLGAVTVVSLVAKSGSPKETATSIMLIVLFLAAVVVTLKLLKFFLWWHPHMQKYFMSVRNPSQIGIRANLFNMFLFASLAAVADLEIILGAFMGGAIFSVIFAEHEEMLERLSGFGYGFLIPIFFIEVGTRFRINDFMSLDIIKGALLLSAVIFIVRSIASIPLLLMNVPKSHLLYVPLGQSFPLTLLVATSTIGSNLGFITKEQSSIVILTAVMTAILFPWLIKLLYKFVPVYQDVRSEHEN